MVNLFVCTDYSSIASVANETEADFTGNAMGIV